MKDNFQQRIMATKKASIWGLGYLGYTMALMLQANGFHVTIYDFSEEYLKMLREGLYPTPDIKELWTQSSEVPILDSKYLTIAKTPQEMFDTPVHLIGFPPELCWSDELRNAFKESRNNLEDPLLIFLAAETPGNVRKMFIDPFETMGLKCGFASAFRSDWILQEFMCNEKEQVLAANDDDSMSQVTSFFDNIEMKYRVLSSIEEAEIYENARKALYYTISAFINQLTLAYPDTNIRKMTDFLARSICGDEIRLSVGMDEYKTESAIEHMLRGSIRSEHLSLIKEAQKTSLSLLLGYANILLKRGIASITILGLSAKRNQKDIRYASSLVLAEYLHRHGVAVSVHDPFFDTNEISKMMPFAKPVVLENGPIPCHAYILMTCHNQYKYMTQFDLDRLEISQAKVIIDNTGLFKNFCFSPTTIYHLVGDGKLAALDV